MHTKASFPSLYMWRLRIGDVDDITPPTSVNSDLLANGTCRFMSASRVPADPGEAGPASPMRSMPHPINSTREDEMASSWLGTNSSPAHRSPVQGSPHYYHQGNMPLRHPSQQDGDPEVRSVGRRSWARCGLGTDIAFLIYVPLSAGTA